MNLHLYIELLQLIKELETLKDLLIQKMKEQLINWLLVKHIQVIRICGINIIFNHRNYKTK